jgi:phospholipase/carboxylesterase
MSMNRQTSSRKRTEPLKSFTVQHDWQAEHNNNTYGGNANHFAIFSPLHYEPNYAYPLLIWLHGPRANETQLREIMPLVSLRNYAAVAPRGTIVSANASTAPASTQHSLFDWQSSPQHVDMAEQRVLQCLELAAAKYNISRQRIFLAGLEQGGTLALQVGLRNPDLFAGAISVNGAFPSNGNVLLQLEKSRRLPLLLTTNRDGTLYPVSQVCQDLRLFHAARMNVMIRQYPAADELLTNMFSDVDRWIMSQFCEGSKSESETLEPSGT